VTDTFVKPVPVPDEESEGFWRAAGEHVLAIRRCTECGYYAYPPTVICHSCLSTARSFAYEPVSGRGKVMTWSVMHQAFLPGFRDDVPYVVVDVELDEQPGLRLVGRLAGPSEGLAIGAPVEVTFEDVGAGMAVPQFALADQS
jgi:uncharacterized protein